MAVLHLHIDQHLQVRLRHHRQLAERLPQLLEQRQHLQRRDWAPMRLGCDKCSICACFYLPAGVVDKPLGGPALTTSEGCPVTGSDVFGRGCNDSGLAAAAGPTGGVL